MSTYDAYNLSLRDSTEFTVPTGGGNSGDSQFSTATLTIVNTDNEIPGAVMIVFPYINTSGNASSFIVSEPPGESTYTIILRNGKAQLFYENPSDATVTGNISFVEGTEETPPYYEITGDAIITGLFK